MSLTRQMLIEILFAVEVVIAFTAVELRDVGHSM
jgi:hypothetical protein